MLENHSNNVNCVILCVHALLRNAAVLKGKGSVRERVEDMEKEFLEIAAFVVLAMAQKGPKELEKMKVVSFASIMILLEKFVSSASWQAQQELEAVVPYALLRSMYFEVYRRKVGPSGKNKGDEEEV
eukprot:TRINITY_DN18213_c0_g1_i1.p1 TRINITY_DN18213_c0_g1~~TRINITY_DN18213_c0_g1_i1.p1  ORF type:complete len:127 (-),score=35.64 TRINITY_DN18213_c0_g1_i1:48-428(-)